MLCRQLEERSPTYRFCGSEVLFIIQWRDYPWGPAPRLDVIIPLYLSFKATGESWPYELDPNAHTLPFLSPTIAKWERESVRQRASVMVSTVNRSNRRNARNFCGFVLRCYVSQFKLSATVIAKAPYKSVIIHTSREIFATGDRQNAGQTFDLVGLLPVCVVSQA